MRALVLGLAGAAAVVAAATAANERSFASGVRWVPLAANVESYIRVEAKAQVCGSGRTIIVVFEDRAQVEDAAVAQEAVLSAARAAVAMCKNLRSINVEAHLRQDDDPDENGVVADASRILRASVSASSGNPRITLVRNKAAVEKQEAEQKATAAAAQAELDAKLARQREEEERKRQEDAARFASQQAEFETHIAKVRELAQTENDWLGWFGGGAEKKLVGVWSNPSGHCDTDLLVFYVQDGHGFAEFWGRAGGFELAPVLQGDWSLQDDIVQLRYTKQLKGAAFTKSVEVTEEEEVGRVRLISADEESLTLTAKGVNDPHPLFFFYPEESKLLRCR